MSYLKAYTDTIRERGNEGLAKTIEKQSLRSRSKISLLILIMSVIK